MRIGVSQRVEVIDRYGERRDCLDQAWFRLLESLGLVPVPLPNSLEHPSAYLADLGLDGFILSGGNDLAHLPNVSRSAPERDRTEAAVLEFSRAQNLPVLGVCRGMQMMNHFLGGRLQPVQGHVATRHVVVPEGGDPLFEAYREVNSFHDWAVPSDGLGQELKARARADDGTVEAAVHTSLPWLAIMWHPERETPFLDADTQLISQLFWN
ncbi:putative glutamine amidotransferase [Natronospira proteinivora]|uniref:Glutamine amidotransferase n=1 Tax=Natronospira proteinivora TaxID=1807133 RepID=A0ABT1G991_9GAMM|nr:putative glutamine amidotransferase [Natronospira proteinivora]